MTLKSTLVHTLELVVVFGAAITVLHFLGVDSDAAKYALGIALGALAKFARTSDAIPMKDYVNE